MFPRCFAIEKGQNRIIDGQRDGACRKLFCNGGQLQCKNPMGNFLVEWSERNDRIKAREKFPFKQGVQRAVAVFCNGLRSKSDRTRCGGLAVCGHHNDGVTKADGITAAVGQCAVVKHLQKESAYIGMCFLNFIEEDKRIRTVSDGRGQTSAVLMSDIPGRCADQTGNGMRFPIFGHVKAQKRMRCVE